MHVGGIFALALQQPSVLFAQHWLADVFVFFHALLLARRDSAAALTARMMLR